MTEDIQTVYFVAMINFAREFDLIGKGDLLIDSWTYILAETINDGLTKQAGKGGTHLSSMISYGILATWFDLLTFIVLQYK